MLIIKRTNEQLNEKVMEFEKQWHNINNKYEEQKKAYGRGKR